ncbi:acyloxyacyl hydrolase [Azospirillum sp. SYSU D00513]|uniref:acyloxyacyl hydrolase n=1 Tax=Azospirillum sp. SYSU D00513 TaxID=2812561 RepID=UPI001A95FF74|nr:acyloxyacyl hydrolase [Azospirillum sp. SYSU D00513]
MRRQPWGPATLAFAALLLHGVPALAQSGVPAGSFYPGGALAGRAAQEWGGEGPGNWKIGAQAYLGETELETTVSNLQNKVRVGSSLLPGLEPYLSVHSWVGFGPETTDGTVQGMGGVLIDVPVGSFVFTPSIGASLLPQTDRDRGGAVQLRSQLELGYEFEDQSRFSLAYSRLSTSGVGPIDGGSTKVLGLYYRMPFSAFLGD